MVTTSKIRTPKRLWLAAIMNILIGLLGVAVLVFLARDSDVATKIRLDSLSIFLGAALAVTLISASIFALLGKRNCHYIMLGVAALYFGLVIFQNVSLLSKASALFNEDGEIRLWSNIVRTGLELALNCWAVLSGKTRAFFASRQDTP